MRGRLEDKYSRFRHRVIEEIRAEAYDQEKEWGIQEHDPDRYGLILFEELVEAVKALLAVVFSASKYGMAEQYDQLEEELIQSAAVIVSWIAWMRTDRDMNSDKYSVRPD